MKNDKHRITLKNIAEETGFTVNTVSRALNDKDDISDNAKRIIKEKAYQLGYMKNSIASSLRTGYTNTIAVIISDIANPFFGALVKYIEKYAALKGYTVIIYNTDENPEIEIRSIKSALEKNIDGIIICPSQNSEKPIKVLIENKCPFVLIGRSFKNYETNYVKADDINGAYLATDYLVKQKNCRKVLFLNGLDYISSAQERLEGYKKALEINGVPYNEHLVKYIGVMSEKHQMDQFINLNVDFDGVFAFSDLLALQILTYWLKHKPQLLEKIPIIGYDNIEKDMFIPYPLSSINYSKQKMAESAINILIENIKKPKLDYIQEVLPTNLVIRD